MRCVAFVRNVNQGQRGHPSTDDIRGAFADAGCSDAVTFQSNGTVVFDSDDPDATAEAAEQAIAARSGYEREVFWITLSDIVALADAHGGVREPRRFELVLHGGGVIDTDDADVAREADRHRCDIIDAGAGWALVRNRIEGEGHATPTLEQITGTRASSRGLPTVLRLADRFGS